MGKKHWYYQKNDGKRHGPYSSRRMKKLAMRGHLKPSDRVWKTGSATAMLAADIPQLFLRTPTTRTRFHILTTLSIMGLFLLLAAVTNPWSTLADTVSDSGRRWLNGVCLVCGLAGLAAGAIGFFRLESTYRMAPPERSSRKTQ
ncbi:MAG: DUF4339 domain-containing protein [Pirellulales bacterium]